MICIHPNIIPCTKPHIDKHIQSNINIMLTLNSAHTIKHALEGNHSQYTQHDPPRTMLQKTNKHKAFSPSPDQNPHKCIEASLSSSPVIYPSFDNKHASIINPAAFHL